MAKRLIIAGIAIVSALGAGGVAPASGAEGEEAALAEHHFVPVELIEAPIVVSNRIEGTFRLKLVLEAGDAGDAAEIDARLPDIRAASVAAAIEFARLYASSFAAVDAERLSASMTAALKRADPRIARVLIVEVAARPA